MLVLVLVVGGGGLRGGFAMAQLRSSYATTAQLERATGMVVLGSVSLTQTAAARAGQWKQLRLFGGGVAGLVLVLMVLMAVEFIKRRMVA
jgi:hypothetical protein